MTETVQKEITLPQGFHKYVNEKLEKNGSGGRPHIVTEFAKQGDPEQLLLDLLELIWVKNKSLRQVARKYGTSYPTLYRLVAVDMKPFKEDIYTYLTQVPRRKTFFNATTETSDYETVQAYIQRAKRPPKVKTWKTVVKTALRCWKFLKYKDPANWAIDDVLSFLETLTYGAQTSMVDAIRQVAPHLKPELRTEMYRQALKRHKKDVFAPEVSMILKALRAKDLDWEETVFKLHVTLGAREGTGHPDSSMCGLSWDRFKKAFTLCDLWESKTKGGLWSRNCPLTIFFKDLPQRLQTVWEERGKPTEAKLLQDYKELTQIYQNIRQAIGEFWHGELDPSLFKELTTMKPHDADRIHVNLLWEAGVPLEVVAGQFLGQGEGLGLMGRIWKSTDTIKKYYLSLTQRSERYKTILKQVEAYSKTFNGYGDVHMGD